MNESASYEDQDWHRDGGKLSSEVRAQNGFQRLADEAGGGSRDKRNEQHDRDNEDKDPDHQNEDVGHIDPSRPAPVAVPLNCAPSKWVHPAK